MGQPKGIARREKSRAPMQLLETADVTVAIGDSVSVHGN